MRSRFALVLPGLLVIWAASIQAQEYGPPDRGEPGDEMIQGYLAAEADRISSTFNDDLQSLENWQERRQKFHEEYLYMLGLWPLPEKTPLQATITGEVEGDGFVVDLIHYQSRPGLYVTGNLYRPAKTEPGERLPAVFYVCGHSNQGRAGNKAAYQSHGIWFAKHGYICLVVDTLQLGEIAAIHHGTYRENRWWWHSRGYTPAGVEAWNGIRGIDYLVSRGDVDPERIAVTGISGGGAATFWIAAADERVKVAVPVSGMADLPSYVGNRVVNGHCDCMFLYNTFQWPWARIAALIAPRAQLFANSDQDRIFPMDANERVINRLERVYSLYEKSDFVDAMVSIGGHAYRKDLRQSAYRFVNTHLKNDPRPVDDSELDLITGDAKDRVYPIPVDALRVFKLDGDIPKDELNTTIDRRFVARSPVSAPSNADFDKWKSNLLSELRRVSFRSFPERIEPGREREHDAGSGAAWIETERGIIIPVRRLAGSEKIERIVLGIASGEASGPSEEWLRLLGMGTAAVYVVEPRGIGAKRWTEKNPPNYVRRSHVLLGQTEETGRVRDIIAAARYLKAKHPGAPLRVAGEKGSALLAAYAALFESEIEAAVLRSMPRSHMDEGAPQFLNVLRVCDVPDIVQMLGTRAVTAEKQ